MRTLILSIIAFSLTACATIPKAIAPSTSPVAPGTRGTVHAQGTSCQYALFGLIPLSESASTYRALRDAKRSGKTKVLTDVTIEQRWNNYIVITSNCIVVDGLAVK